MPAADSPRRLSEIVGELAKREDVTIGSMVDAFGERAFGALMFVFAIPNIVPAPPGTSAILGLPLIILTFQLMIGRQFLWLPQAIRKRPISKAMLAGFARFTVSVLTRFEKVLKPRLTFLASSDVAERVIGVVAFLLSVVVFLPIPLANILPAAAIACLAIGLAERDGLAVVIGYALSIVTILLLGVLSTALIAAGKAFVSTLMGV